MSGGTAAVVGVSPISLGLGYREHLVWKLSLESGSPALPVIR